ncbi:MAG TPA: NADH-quinone oxidoreductase subunit J [Armatimonadota bacterium]|nr:NADH-quinone oxidoreductase subunit J [Armatimonadota bacterium]
MGSVVFYFFAFAALACAVIVVTSRHIVRSVAALFVCMAAMAGIYFFLSAPFIGAMQLMIYAGGITVLLIFAVMLVRRAAGGQVEHASRNPGGAIVVVIGFVGWMAPAAWMAFGPRQMPPVEPRVAGVESLADDLIRHYVPAFEIASVLLLVAMIGAVVLTLRAKQREGPPTDDE